MSFLGLRNRDQPAILTKEVLDVGLTGLRDTFLQDTLCAVKYECDPNREGLLDGVPVNDRSAIAQLMVSYAEYQKKLYRHARKTGGITGDNDVQYFLARQRG